MKTRGTFGRIVLSGLVLAYAGGYVLHRLHSGMHEAHDINPWIHWLRDSTLALAPALVVVLLATILARSVVPRLGIAGNVAWERLTWVLAVAVGYATFSVPGNLVHGSIFGASHEGMGLVEHLAADGFATLGASLGIFAVLVLLIGTPWERRPPHVRLVSSLRAHGARGALALGFGSVLDRRWRLAPALLGVVTMATLVALVPRVGGADAATQAAGCATFPGGTTRTIKADVVALEQKFFYNRLGTQAGANPEPYGLMYALRRDVVAKPGEVFGPGKVQLRAGKRPRPLVVRMNVGDCLQISFQNLLGASPKDDHPADRHVGIHVNGMQLGGEGLGEIGNDGSFVGENSSSLAAPGQSKTYTLFAEYENTYLLYSLGTPVGGEGLNASIALGLFGAVNVEPFGTEWYRSQVTREEMDWAKDLETPTTPTGQPLLDYGAVYPTGAGEGRDGLPILSMLQGDEIVHSDLNAVITGPERGSILPQSYPAQYWQNENYNQFRDRGEEPFREFTVIFHDEIKAVQAFEEFSDPVLSHTLHGVVDGFAINYGASGAGAEILANRKKLGPMGKCIECKYEEFFLSSWTVGDPAMVVDKPANTAPVDGEGVATVDTWATKALYPDDPANVHHSYLNDRVKFRNLHAGPKEHHIFHLHAHQWQYDWNDKRSSYLDSQNIGPGGGFTYEIAHGGSGNRNKTVGDSIFHCHFYPHFAQGMWALWRVHDTFEIGTKLDASGLPIAGSRAFPDGEITAGTPIPGVVPLPGMAMAPMPNPATTVVPYDLDGIDGPDSSQVNADGDLLADVDEIAGGEAFAIEANGAGLGGKNPGYPFFVPGVAGHRPPTPPMDLKEDGGLERHIVVDGTAESFTTRLDMNRELTEASVVYLPENGTPAEQAAMTFHSQASHPTSGGSGSFETNGLPAVPGAPFADPCRPDKRPAGWTNPVSNQSTTLAPIGSARPYKAAVIELDATLNKLGWHFPQQRILALNQDVGPALAGTRAPEPLVMRLNVGDCTTFEHTNLVPNVYELDDYQVRTPTDIIGQHIHLVKFDVLSADGSANGFNYEDGTLSPEEVEERIRAIRAKKAATPGQSPCTNDTSTASGEEARLDVDADPKETASPECPLARKHPYFGGVAGVGPLAWGARTTVQRWYADPVLNNSWDKGVGSVFTHDHYGPSTHQQVGLYATVLVEPEGSTWRHSWSGDIMGSRGAAGNNFSDPLRDGGPTSWRADILTQNAANSFREFYLEYSDFQHAYEDGGGVTNGGQPIPDFANVINPSFRKEPPTGHLKDLFWFPPFCPGGVLRPCPEAISADDPGTYVVNYRNEPIAARVFAPTPTPKTQATGARGDLSRAFESRTDRAWGAMNKQPTVYPPLTPDVRPGDPFTPLLPVYQGDKVRIRAQVGGQEEEHNFTLHGLKWMHEPRNDDSGWRAGSPSGISEYFNLEMPMTPDLSTGQSNKNTDYVWEAGAQTEGRWNGIWGLMRSYGKARGDLQKLPNNQIPTTGWTISNLNEFTQACPKKTNGTQTPTRRYSVTAVRAKLVLNDNPLVYNDRGSKLVDPNALLYVFSDDLVRDGGNITGLKPGTPLEPLVLRAAAGDCIKVDLENALPATVEDHDGFNSLPPIIRKNEVNGGFTTFNANDIRPSNRVGLAPQLVAHDVRKSGGLEVGADNGPNTVGPGESKQYTWYAGELSYKPDGAGKLRIDAKPVEFGAVNLMAADPIKGASKGLGGALVIEPPGASWKTDGDSRVAATVSFPGGEPFREFVTVLQDDLNLRKGGCDGDWDECAIPNVNGEGGGFPEDPQDSGQKGINYGAEPLWHRLGVPANTPFESPALLGSTNVHKAFSNTLVGGEDPQTAVFAASPKAGPTSIRMRLVQPGGHARGHEFTVHGHAWQRQPYIEDSNRLNRDFHGDPTCLSVVVTVCDPGEMKGHNMTSWWVSSQEGMGPTVHYDLMFKERGGEFATEGDYLFRDFGSFGTFQGLWGIMRVDLTPAIAARDAFIAPPNATFQVSAGAGVKANDLDLDGNPLPAAVVIASVKNGTLSLASDGSFSYTPKAGFIGRDAFTYRLGGTGGATAVAEIRVRSNPPSTGTDYAGVAAGSSEVVIPVLANDTDPEGDQLKLIITEDDLVKVERIQGTSAKGAVFPYGATSVRYAPYAGATGTDAFKYTVEDATGNRVTGTVYVTITSGGEGSVTVSSVVWSKKDAKWTIKGSTGTLEVQKTTSTSALLGTKAIGSASVAAIPDGKAWQIGPTANAAPKSCGEKVTVKSALGPTITGVSITCK